MSEKRVAREWTITAVKTLDGTHHVVSGGFSLPAGTSVLVREILPDENSEIAKLKEDLGFWKKEAMLHSDAREQFKGEIAKLKDALEVARGAHASIIKNDNTGSGMRLPDIMTVRDCRRISSDALTRIDSILGENGGGA